MSKRSESSSIIADRIKKQRTHQGWSQSELAEKLGEKLGRNLDKDTVGTYERGTRRVPNDVLSALADVFNVSTEYLLGRTESSLGRTDDTVIRDAESNDGKMLHTIACMSRGALKMTPSEKKKMINMLKSVWPEIFQEEDEKK